MRSSFSFCMRKHREEFGDRGCALVQSTLPLWMDGISDRPSGHEALGRRMENSSQPEIRRGRFLRSQVTQLGLEPQSPLSGQFDFRAQHEGTGLGVPTRFIRSARSIALNTSPNLVIGRPPFHLYLQRVCVQRPLDYFDFSRGTLAPLFRASDSPIAIACFLLFTIPPLPPFPERRVPRFLRRMAARTDSLAAFPYLAIVPSCGFVPVIESLHTRRFGDEN